MPGSKAEIDGNIEKRIPQILFHTKFRHISRIYSHYSYSHTSQKAPFKSIFPHFSEWIFRRFSRWILHTIIEILNDFQWEIFVVLVCFATNKNRTSSQKNDGRKQQFKWLKASNSSRIGASSHLHGLHLFGCWTRLSSRCDSSISFQHRRFATCKSNLFAKFLRPKEYDNWKYW